MLMPLLPPHACLCLLSFLTIDSLASVQDFVTVGEIYQQEDTVNAQFVINPDKAPASADKRVYSSNFGRRTFNEVCVLCDEQPAKRSVMLRFREGGLYETDESSRAYDPLHFVLLFPCGDDGWHPYMPRALPEVAGTFERSFPGLHTAPS